ncbi:MAG: hypothetical protein ABFC80_08345 [Coriobacteriales bacterium]
MLGVLIGLVVMAGACAYAVGHAFGAPRESVFRSGVGGLLLGVAVLFALVVVPSVASFAVSRSGGTWPQHLGPQTYHSLWVVCMGVGLLLGLRVWRMRPSAGGALGFDESGVARARSQLPLADSLESALDVLGREKLTARDIESLEDAVKALGARFWHRLPEKDSEVYLAVRQHVPTEFAARITRSLLAGAGRKH